MSVNLQISTSENSNQLGTLPREIQSHILSFAPIVDAAKTGLLSRKLRSAWYSISKLIFDYNHFPGAENDPELFAQFIDKTLTDHDRSDVKIFKIVLWPTEKCNIPIEDKWIIFATQHSVENLVLYGNLDEFQNFPSCVFSCSSLVKLELAIENIVLTWPENIALPNLKKLKFRSLILAEVESTRDLFSSFPSLEKLSIFSCYITTWNTISITSSRLKEFTICNCEGMESCLINLETPFLSKFVYLNIGVGECHLNIPEIGLGLVLIAEGPFMKIGNTENLSRLVIKVTKELFKANCLYFSHWLLEYLCLARDLPKQLDFNLSPSLTMLNINLWSVMPHVITTMLLVSRCPSLEILNVTIMESEIHSLGTRNVELNPEDWATGEGFAHLKVIVIEKFDGNEITMSLLKFLLGSACDLCLMRVLANSEMNFDRTERNSRILGYEKASNHARIVFD